ncbi:MAG: hypothetical protein AB7I27_11750 [Bacteriovoracaceae bacterium]
MKTKINKLNPTIITELLKKYKVFSFTKDCDLVYENHVPNTAVALVEGEVEITKKSKAFEKITENCLIGLHHLMHHEPAIYGCRIKKDTKVLLIGKSELKDELKNKDSHLYELFIKSHKN